MTASRTLDCRIGVWPASVQVSGGGLFWRLPTECWCGSLPDCSRSGTVTRRGSKVIIGVDPYKLTLVELVLESGVRCRSCPPRGRLAVGEIRHALAERALVDSDVLAITTEPAPTGRSRPAAVLALSRQR